MTDQCQWCTCKGDLKACKAAECHQHENWYAKQQQALIEQLQKENAELKEQSEALASCLRHAIQGWDYDGVSPEHGAVIMFCEAVLHEIDPTPYDRGSKSPLNQIKAEAVRELKEPLYKSGKCDADIDVWLEDHAARLEGDTNE